MLTARAIIGAPLGVILNLLQIGDFRQFATVAGNGCTAYGATRLRNL